MIRVNDAGERLVRMTADWKGLAVGLADLAGGWEGHGAS